MNWELKHPQATLEMLGYVPILLSEADPKPASEQIDQNYRHGGGWSSFKGFKLLSDGTIQYQGWDEFGQDPPLRLIAEAKLRDETIRLYEGAWLMILQKDGSYDIARVD